MCDSIKINNETVITKIITGQINEILNKLFDDTKFFECG